MFCEIPSVLYQNRYCTQETFDFLFASGFECVRNSSDYKNYIVKIKYPSFSCVEKHVSKKYWDVIKIVSVGSFVCTISSCKDVEENFTLGDQYFGKQWKNDICMLNKRTRYCVCSFLKQVFVIGGYYTNSCMRYDHKNLF